MQQLGFKQHYAESLSTSLRKFSKGVQHASLLPKVLSKYCDSKDSISGHSRVARVGKNTAVSFSFVSWTGLNAGRGSVDDLYDTARIFFNGLSLREQETTQRRADLPEGVLGVRDQGLGHYFVY